MAPSGDSTTDALNDYATSPLFTELERLIIRYAEEMTRKVQVDAGRSRHSSGTCLRRHWYS